MGGKDRMGCVFQLLAQVSPSHPDFYRGPCWKTCARGGQRGFVAHSYFRTIGLFAPVSYFLFIHFASKKVGYKNFFGLLVNKVDDLNGFSGGILI